MQTTIYIKEDDDGNEEIKHIHDHPEFDNSKDVDILEKMGQIRLMRFLRESQKDKQ